MKVKTIALPVSFVWRGSARYSRYSDYFQNTLNFNNILSIANNKIQNNSNIQNSLLTNFRTYLFKRLPNFEINYLPFLNPPFGENIPNILQSKKEWKQMVSDF